MLFSINACAKCISKKEHNAKKQQKIWSGSLRDQAWRNKESVAISRLCPMPHREKPAFGDGVLGESKAELS